MSVNATDIRELKAIVDWASLTEGVRELSLKVGDVELFISKNEHTRNSAASSAPVAAPAVSPAPAAAAPAASARTGSCGAPLPRPLRHLRSRPELVLAPGEIVVKSPIVGTSTLPRSLVPPRSCRGRRHRRARHSDLHRRGHEVDEQR